MTNPIEMTPNEAPAKTPYDTILRLGGLGAGNITATYAGRRVGFRVVDQMNFGNCWLLRNLETGDLVRDHVLSDIVAGDSPQ